jgi:hypothetical protein
LWARKINQWVRLHYINGSLLLINNNYSEINNKLLGSEPNDYMAAPPLLARQVTGGWPRSGVGSRRWAWERGEAKVVFFLKKYFLVFSSLQVVFCSKQKLYLLIAE